MGVAVLGFKILDDNFVSMALLREVLAEIVGTFFLVFLGCAGINGLGNNGVDLLGNKIITSGAVLQISFAFSLGIGGIVHIFSDISGGQLNPAVSFGLFFARQLSLVRALIFSVAQTIGGIVGCGVLKVVIGNVPGAVGVAPNLSGFQGLFLEFFGTLFLVLTVLSTTNGKRGHSPGYLQPFSIGISIFVAHMFLVRTTGCGINPARSLATNVFNSGTINATFYAYIIGPLLASVVGGLVYEFVFNPHYRPASHQPLEQNGEEMEEKA